MFEPMEFGESCEVKAALAAALEAMSHFSSDMAMMETVSKLHAHACVANADAFREHERREKAKKAS